MALDAFTNFAISSLVSGISAGATSLTVLAGEGAKFPAVSFNATIWNSTDFSSAYLDTNAEIVRVTANAADVFTITRAQEGTAAVAHNTAAKTYKILAGLTALNLNKALDKTGDTMTGRLTVTGADIVTNQGYGYGVSAVQTTSASLTASSPETQLWNPGAGQTVTLPAANAVPTGRAFAFVNLNAANAMTIAAAGADTITNGGTVAGTSSVAAVARLYLRSDGSSKWYRVQ